MTHWTDKEREELVAYLDGELDEHKAKALEARLTLDPQARAEATALRKTWELLDYLPRSEPSASFTHRTLERIAAPQTAAALARLRMRRWPAWLSAVAWAAGILLAIGAGFAGMTWLTPARQSDQGSAATRADPLATMPPDEIDRQLVTNLRLLENKRLYENVDDLEFLKELDQPDLFGDDR